MSRSDFPAVLVLAALAALSGCQQYPTGGSLRLHSDMVDQPSFRPQRDPLPLAQGSIPIKGWEAPLTPEQAAQLRNPVPATAESLRRGEMLFLTYCRPCHGASGRGDGPIAAKILKPANFHDAKYLEAKDGFFYYVVRYGGVIMPPQTESLAPPERWYVIDYLRKLQRP
jgi:mono/diheme cytochrome c family protein